MEEAFWDEVYEPGLVYKPVHLLDGNSHSGKEVLGLFKSMPSQYLLLIYKTKARNGYLPLFSVQQIKLSAKILVRNFSWEVLKSGDGWTYSWPEDGCFLTNKWNISCDQPHCESPTRQAVDLERRAGQIWVFDYEGERFWAVMGVEILMKHSTRGKGCLSARIQVILYCVTTPMFITAQLCPYLPPNLSHC